MKDGVGNALAEGDLVALSLERPMIFGTVDSIETGGIVTGIKGRGEPELRPCRVVILSKHTIEVDPRSPLLGAVLKLHDPQLAAQVRAEVPAVIDAGENKPN